MCNYSCNFNMKFEIRIYSTLSINLVYRVILMIIIFNIKYYNKLILIFTPVEFQRKIYSITEWVLDN